MKIKSINIKNFKSIVNLTIENPNPFTVFVGPNGSGKSNIFEALEFAGGFLKGYVLEIEEIKKNTEITNRNAIIDYDKIKEYIAKPLNEINDPDVRLNFLFSNNAEIEISLKDLIRFSNFEKDELFKNYRDFNIIFQLNRLFIGNKKYKNLQRKDNRYLTNSANNLDEVLKRLLENKEKYEEISEWLGLFIPEFKKIEISKEQINGKNQFLIYEKFSAGPFDKALLSDGTYNILALLTAVFQSDEPQFLCIEEPENGLHPKVIKELVHLFREACEEKRHYIWLNTHSQTLVSQLKPEEIILVNKKERNKKYGRVFFIYAIKVKPGPNGPF